MYITALPNLKANTPVREIHTAMDTIRPESIGIANWPSFPYKPEVTFQAACNGGGLFLRYSVRENCIRAKYLEDFGAVWTDSCVEFFVSPDGGKGYYNFEFNAIGTALLCYGINRENRQQAPTNVMNKILRYPTLGRQAIASQQGEFIWNLLLYIPVEALFLHQISSFAGKTMMANFYKCGDETATPHYLSWNPVNTKTPDFHRPEYFREIHFTAHPEL